MSRLVDHWSLSSFALLSVARILQFLRQLGLRPREDGFRRSTRAFFRSQGAHPCLAVFGLDVRRFWDGPPPPRIQLVGDRTVAELRIFLASRPDMQSRLRWGRVKVDIVDRTSVDILRATFDENDRLTSLDPCLDPLVSIEGLAPNDVCTICRAMIRAYDETRLAPDKRRPLLLRHSLLRHVRDAFSTSRKTRDPALLLAERLLSAIWAHFEQWPTDCEDSGMLDPLARVQPPTLLERMAPGPGGLAVAGRFHPNLEAVDMWFQFHHALFDGVPFAEMLSDLEEEWSVATALVLPSPQQPGRPRPRRRCSGPGTRESWVLEDWLDFRPLLSARRRLETVLAGTLSGQNISTVGLLLWRLAQHDAFKDVKFTIVIDLPAAEGRERTLGIVPIRPAVFFDDRDPDAAFVAFNRELLRRIRDTRERRSESYELVESLALLPPSLYPVALALVGRGIRECIGTVGISVIPQTAVVMAAQSDIHIDGFLGLGCFDLPTVDDRRAGIIMIKGPPQKLDAYQEAVRAIVAAETC